MSLLESGENYLEAILMVKEKKDSVHAIDIVNELNFSKPSVSIMLKKLKEEKYINIDSKGDITLTDSGLEIATKIYERHKLLTSLLIKIGVSPEVAEDDACKIEHDLSTETFEAIKNIVDKFLKIEDEVYHTDCLRCYQCNCPIIEYFSFY